MRTLALLLVLLVLTLAACGGDDAAETTAGDTGGAAGQTVDVSAVEFAFEPADISVEAGAVSFELSNDGSAPHALAIEELDVATDVIDGGASTSLDTELEEGTYVIFCPVGDHRERGMEGTLTVGSGGGGAGVTGTDTGETDTDGVETGESGGDDSAGSGGAGGY